MERQGNLVAPRTLEFYDRRVGELITWLRSEAPTVDRIEDVGVNHIRAFRAFMTEHRHPDGQPLQAATLHASHRAIHTFLAWAQLDGYGVDGLMPRLPPPRRPHKEATLYHLTQLRAILTACRRPEETVAVTRVLVGSGLRISELSGLALRGPDGLCYVMLGSLERGRAKLRVRWDAGAKGREARRVPITPQLALAIKRYLREHVATGGARDLPATFRVEWRASS